VEYVGGVSSVEVDCAAIELGDRQQVDLHGGDDAGHRVAAPQTPEEVGVFVGGDAEHLAPPGHQLERPHVVGGQPDGAHQRADAAAGQVADDAHAGAEPHIGARPCGVAASSTVCHVTPPPTRAVSA
jgi:hypothetical protein